MGCGRIFAALRRCKTLDNGDSSSQLNRCLGLLDLTMLGVGSTLGLGVYVLAGAVAKTVAGPAVTLSFLFAAIASVFAGLCYAEFAARVPKAGSAYVYSYVSVGEFIAFTIGWNLVLEYVIGTASMAKGMSLYIDSMCNNKLAKTMTEALPIRVSFLADYPDFLAFSVALGTAVLLGVGVKESTKFNNVFTAMNLLTVVTVVVAGAVKSDTANWSIDPADIPPEYAAQAGVGGFMPFGLAGVMAGAAKCFFGFVGFDCVATTGEEAKNPKRNIPLSIVLSLIIIFIAYFSISTSLTLMLPYYLLDAEAPFPNAFKMVDLPTVKWIATIGAVFALCTNLVGAMFPLPRVLYAMGTDGVLFRPLAKIHPRTQTPLLATGISGLFAATMAAIFNLNQLIDMISIGTLLAYTIVAISVLILRYGLIIFLSVYVGNAISVLILRYEEESPINTGIKPIPETAWSVIRQTFNLQGLKFPTHLSSAITKTTILVVFIVSLITCALLRWDQSGAALLGIMGAVLIVLLVVLCRQPRNSTKDLSFTVPLVPLIPYLSVCMNVYLMVQLDYQTWVRFIIWLIVGYIIYFCYGIRHSSLNNPPLMTKRIDENLERNEVATKF